MADQSFIQSLIQQSTAGGNNGNPGTIYNWPRGPSAQPALGGHNPYSMYAPAYPVGPPTPTNLPYNPAQPLVNQYGQPAQFTGYNLLPETQFQYAPQFSPLPAPPMLGSAGAGNSLVSDILSRILNPTGPGAPSPGGGGAPPPPVGGPAPPPGPGGAAPPPGLGGGAAPIYGGAPPFVGPSGGSQGSPGAPGGGGRGGYTGLVTPGTPFQDSAFRGINTQGWTGPGNAPLVGGIPNVAGGYSGTTNSATSGWLSGLGDSLRSAFTLPRDADGSVSWTQLFKQALAGAAVPGGGALLAAIQKFTQSNPPPQASLSDFGFSSGATVAGQTPGGTPPGGNYNFLAQHPTAAMPGPNTVLGMMFGNPAMEGSLAPPPKIPTTSAEMSASWAELFPQGQSGASPAGPSRRDPRSGGSAGSSTWLTGAAAQDWVAQQQINQMLNSGQRARDAMDKMFKGKMR